MSKKFRVDYDVCPPVDVRRRILVSTAGVITLAPLTALSKICAGTPVQTQGPFYPLRWSKKSVADLTAGGRAAGQIVELHGRVLDKNCRPLSGARVELWQANHWGRYRHPRDGANSAKLDPNFSGAGWVFSDAQGDYAFRTIKPSSYPAGPGWVRPPHIHFQIVLSGYKTLTTQMYFDGDTLNDEDLILRRIPASERSRVIVKFEKKDGVLYGNFRIHLASGN